MEIEEANEKSWSIKNIIQNLTVKPNGKKDKRRKSISLECGKNFHEG